MRPSQLLHGLVLAAGVVSSLTTRDNAATAAAEDYSVNIIESTMSRFTPNTLGTWEYFVSLYLMGQYATYKRTGKRRYFEYIEDWAERWFDDNGKFKVNIKSLDDIQGGNILLILYQETGKKKYADAARVVRNTIDGYPTTSVGGFWHGPPLKGQLWADGTFMVNPFLARWGYLFGDTNYAFEEAVKQILIYGRQLMTDDGILLHAYDETRKAPWANPATGLSGWKWGRAFGWFGLAITDLLDLIPENQPRRGELLTMFRTFMDGVEKYQNMATGRWYQVVDRGSDRDNWLETSCSAMFTYTADIALKRGWLPDRNGKFSRMVRRGYEGVLSQVVENDKGLTDVREICIGTGVGDLQHYYNRPRRVNDLHGLGAVLLMNEQVAHNGYVLIGGF